MNCSIRWLLAGSLLGIVVPISGCHRSRAAREATPDRFCEIKLELLGKGIVDYRSEHGDLPEVRLGPGELRHSWRAVVAPYVLTHTYHPDTFHYRFEEAWDSPYNRDAFRKSGLAGYLTCPAEKESIDYPFVSYVMLARADSPGSNEEGSETMPLPDDAVLIVESVGCRIKYGEPRDIDIEALFKDDSPFGVGKLNSLHPKVVKALRVDGKVIDIPKNITKEDLRKLLAGTATK